MASDGFLEEALNLTEFTRPGLAFPALVGVVAATNEWVSWKYGPSLSAVNYIGIVVQVPAWIAAVYISSMAMIGIQLSWSGFARFALSTVTLMLPIIAGVAGILILLPSQHKNLILYVAISLIFFGWIAMTLLPSWPVAQALSRDAVSPYRILKATKGHRWPLFVISFVFVGLNRMVPSTLTARNGGEAAILAMGNGLVSFASIMLAVNLGVTAWRYATRSDPSLQGNEIQR